MASAREKERLLGAFSEWAKTRRLSAHRHDAQFRGLVRETPVEVETGIRASDLYAVVATIYFACGLGTKVVRDAPGEPDDAPTVARLRSVLRRPSVLALRLDEDTITLRMRPGTTPEEVGDALDEALAAARSPGEERGPYR
ncbi:MAG TPA: hypothetical protein VM204_08930 [Gaiellaceae bacterium]|nr:hypothetical protein [Gaiellaceae bacterium]